MAVFMLNICKFNGCGITFPSLGDLIQHIEDTHIDYDPLVMEQKEAAQPSCLHLSYVLRFLSEPSRRENALVVPEVRRRLVSAGNPPSVRSGTPTGSEFDDEELLSGQSEDSNDSWTTVEEFSSEFILRYGSRISSHNSGPAEKPFACPVPGCKKRYKNVNGIKYHSKNGHKKDGKVRKGYKCHCGKNYKTAQGLKGHSIAQHIAPHIAPGQRTSPPNHLPYFSSLSNPISVKPVGLPVMKALQGLVAANQKDLGRQLAHILDSKNDGDNVIREVLENVGKKCKYMSKIGKTQTSLNTNNELEPVGFDSNASLQVCTQENGVPLELLTPASSPGTNEGVMPSHIPEGGEITRILPMPHVSSSRFALPAIINID